MEMDNHQESDDDKFCGLNVKIGILCVVICVLIFGVLLFDRAAKIKQITALNDRLHENVIEHAKFRKDIEELKVAIAKLSLPPGDPDVNVQTVDVLVKAVSSFDESTPPAELAAKAINLIALAKMRALEKQDVEILKRYDGGRDPQKSTRDSGASTAGESISRTGDAIR